MPTQKEVAERAGVSFITVSRVINNGAHVRESTRKRVEQAIRELGYEPSFAGKALNTGKNDTIGVMAPSGFGDMMENAYLMGVLRGIEAACREANKDVLISPITENGNTDYLRPYRQRKVDGMIYIGLRRMNNTILGELANRKIPCVVIGDRPQVNGVCWVDTDNEEAGYETTRRIIDQGHRHIAFHSINEDMYNPNIFGREKGYKRALREAFGSGATISVLRAGYDRESVRGSVLEVFGKPGETPTALFCATDNQVIAALSAFRKLGICVPSDVSLVGFDGFLPSFLIEPEIATNVQPLEDMGRTAVTMLIAQSEQHAAQPHGKVFPVSFIPGQSLAPPRNGQGQNGRKSAESRR